MTDVEGQFCVVCQGYVPDGHRHERCKDCGGVLDKYSNPTNGFCCLCWPKQGIELSACPKCGQRAAGLHVFCVDCGVMMDSIGGTA